MEQLNELRKQAQKIGVFFPLTDDTSALDTAGELHGYSLKSRRILMMQPGNDGTETGAPSEETVRRYENAVRQLPYSIVVLEPAAILPEARYFSNGLVISAENQDAFTALNQAICAASEAAFGIRPLIVALLDHAGHHALRPAAMEHSASLPTDAPILTDDELTALVVVCANAAKAAVAAGCSGLALNAADRSLFGESLAAFHRDGRFGGDFDDRTRFVRDCYTAMKMIAGDDVFYSVRLSLSDGIPQPDGWGMAFEDESAPDLYEPALLTTILRALYGVELILCSIGIPDVNWMGAAEPESDLIRLSRLCTCIAMLDSDRQQNVQLAVPEISAEDAPFANLAAGMIAGEFASFGGFMG
ncbi:MAG: hypothetical protein IKQ91_10755 [Oscillospiraceae bacterium]|nr:hypothetical protein [Oscillospiraceae bacterium]